MKTVSLRHMQHHLSEIIRHVDAGQEVLVTRRNRVIARLVPEPGKSSKVLKWPNFSKRAKAVKVSGRKVSETILSDRER